MEPAKEVKAGIIQFIVHWQFDSQALLYNMGLLNKAH